MKLSIEKIAFAIPSKNKTFTTKRISPSGKMEIVKTTFDHALISLKLYELTEDKIHLEKHMSYFNETANNFGSFTRWNFSPLVTDIPSDADSTALSLLFFSMAKRNKIEIPRDFEPDKNIQQFRDKTVKTFFGARERDEFDPVVNTALAFLYLTNKSKIIPTIIKKYLCQKITELSSKKEFSKYYPNGVYFAERMAKLSFYCPSLLDDEKKKILDNYLSNYYPKNILETSLLSIGASYMGLISRAKSLNRLIEKKRGKNGAWSFATLYHQRTPRYNYGSEVMTSLFAVEALALETEGLTKVELN